MGVNLKKALLSGLFALLSLSKGLYAQDIIDDSTRLVYGPHTTFYTTEEKVFFGDTSFQRIDTLLDAKQRWTFTGMRDNRYQDLGNVGTAMQPVFFEAPEQIGRRGGITVYEPYMRNGSDFQYYHTRSPYTKLFLGLGGNGRSIVDVTHSRNMGEYWNAGFHYQSITADKQVGATGQLDRNVLSSQYDFFLRHMSKDSAYQFMGYASRLGHDVVETGGIVYNPTGENADNESVLFDEDSRIWMRNSRAFELRHEYHLYHQYQFSKLVEVYHRFDKKKQKNTFRNIGFQNDDRAYFNRFFISNDSTVDAVTWRELQNEVGLKGAFEDVFYNFYYKRRDLRFVYKYLPKRGPVTENYGGFRLGYQFSPRSTLRGYAEYLQGGKYQIGARWENKLYDVQGRRVVYTPSFMAQDYFGNHREWHREYTATPQVDVIDARLKLGNTRWRVEPTVSIQNLSNPVFFGPDTLPEQITSTAQILSAGVDAYLPLGKMRFVPSVRATEVSGAAARAVSIPNLFVNAQVYYENILFDGNLQAQIGMDVHWKSDYYPYGYDPVTQQFYVQDNVEAPSYVLADFFANLRINKTIIVFKMSNLLQGLEADGYVVGPYYVGPDRTFDLSVHWYFYD